MKPSRFYIILLLFLLGAVFGIPAQGKTYTYKGGQIQGSTSQGSVAHQSLATWGFPQSTQLFWNPGNHDKGTLLISVPQDLPAGSYRVKAKLTLAPVAGTFTFLAGDTRLSEIVDCHHSETKPFGKTVDLGEVNCSPGGQFTVKLIGKSSASSHYYFGLDGMSFVSTSHDTIIIPTQVTEYISPRAEWQTRRWHDSKDKTVGPTRLSSYGSAPSEVSAAGRQIQAGFQRFYRKNGLNKYTRVTNFLGHIRFPDIAKELGYRPVKSAYLKLTLVGTRGFQMDGVASNALRSYATKLTRPTQEYSAWNETDRDLITELPDKNGQSTEYASMENNAIIIDVTDTVERWRRNFLPNHGFIIEGPRHGRQENNDYHHSIYEFELIVEVEK